MKKAFILFNEGVVWVEKILIAILSLTILTVIFWQVICRYILLISTPWAEELARYSFICLSYIGAGTGIYYSLFVSIDLVDKVLEWTLKDPAKVARGQRIVEKMSICLTLVFLIVFGHYAIQYVKTIGQMGQASVAMHLKLVYPMMSIPIGMACMTIHSLCLLFTTREERETVLEEAKRRTSR